MPPFLWIFAALAAICYRLLSPMVETPALADPWAPHFAQVQQWLIALRPEALEIPYIYIVYGSMFALLMGAALGAFFLTRAMGRGRFWGVVAAFFFMVAPYMGDAIYKSSNWNDLLILLLSPWPFFGYMRFARSIRDHKFPYLSSPVFAASLLGMVVLNRYAAVWTALVIALFFLKDLLRGPKRLRLLLGGLVLAGVMAGAYMQLALPKPEPIFSSLCQTPCTWQKLAEENPMQIGFAAFGFLTMLIQRYAFSGLAAFAGLLFLLSPESTPYWPKLSPLADYLSRGTILPMLWSVVLVGIILGLGRVRRICPPIAGGVSVVLCAVVFASAYPSIIPHVSIANLVPTHQAAKPITPC